MRLCSALLDATAMTRASFVSPISAVPPCEVCPAASHRGTETVACPLWVSLGYLVSATCPRAPRAADVSDMPTRSNALIIGADAAGLSAGVEPVKANRSVASWRRESVSAGG
jgi:hypothetical protein